MFRSLRLALPVMIAGMVLSGCGSHQADDGPKTAPRWQWKRAPENSVIFSTSLSGKSGSTETRRRCWARGGRYDCLYVLNIGQSYSAHRYQMKSLNLGFEDDPTQASTVGYSCVFYGDGLIEESIAGTGDVLTTKKIVPGESMVPSGWSAAWVADFVKSNGINAPDTHFDCEGLANRINAASMDTVGSTVVSYAEIMR